VKSLEQGQLNDTLKALGAQSIEDAGQILVNTTVDGVLSIIFALMIILVIADAARVWIGVISGKKEPATTEVPWHESRLDSEGREIQEPVGARS
jgi:carbon starvation protein